MPEIFGALPRGGAVSDLEIARQNQPRMRPIGGEGQVSEAEFEAYRNAIQRGSSAVEGPTQRYLDYMKMFQQFDPVKVGAQVGAQPRALPVISAPQDPSGRPPTGAELRADATRNRPMGFRGEELPQNLDDFMSNLGRKALGN